MRAESTVACDCLTAAAEVRSAASAASTSAFDKRPFCATERARSVAQKGLLSKADVDAAEAAERTSAAAVKQSQATVDSARITLGYTSVTAPISGRAGQQQVT